MRVYLVWVVVAKLSWYFSLVARFENNKGNLTVFICACLIPVPIGIAGMSVNLERDLILCSDKTFFFFFYNFEECEILLSEFDRGMELVVVVVVFLRVSRASRS